MNLPWTKKKSGAETVITNIAVALAKALGDIAAKSNIPEQIAAAVRGTDTAPTGHQETIVASIHSPKDIGNNAATPTKATATEVEAAHIGKIIAESYLATLTEKSEDYDYAMAINYLNTQNALAGYDLKDIPPPLPLTPISGGLAKLSSGQALSRQDIISAANELAEQEQIAGAAEEANRDETRAFATLLTKLAPLMKDPTIIDAINILKANDLL